MGKRIWQTHQKCPQDKAIWVIAGVTQRAKIDNLYLELNILPVENMFVYTMFMFVYKCIDGMLPDLFLTMFTFVSDSRNHDTRQATKISCFIDSHVSRPPIYHILASIYGISSYPKSIPTVP